MKNNNLNNTSPQNRGFFLERVLRRKQTFLFLGSLLVSISPPSGEQHKRVKKPLTKKQKIIIVLLSVVSLLSMVMLFLLIAWIKGYI